ncbi:hypothetical protein [Sphingopyxis granuli]|uniref:hypothetical protein n=1 Tax=Sphingopyxis granuli TaxID=267128 RepID=UPI001BAFF09C|nr:hypothetical protein [Sphingopyxis granuli]QUM73312.1 hypothetical protein ICN83_05345 [Sphingopyxis granuli]
MDNLFSKGTTELLNDAAVNAIDDTRNAGIPDWDAREEFLKAAGAAFDLIAADQEDADPDGTAADDGRPEFLG